MSSEAWIIICFFQFGNRERIKDDVQYAFSLEFQEGKKLNHRKKEQESARFELRFHSGYKGKEIPRAVVIGNREFNIQKIVSQKRVLDQTTGKTYEVFQCMMEGKKVEIIHFESGKWEISFLDEV
jgi:hypothetical protein